jgi:hypothetical protein
MAGEVGGDAGLPRHVMALVVACAWGLIAVIARMILGVIVDVNDTWNYVLFAVGIVVAGLLLMRWFFLFRRFKAGQR